MTHHQPRPPRSCPPAPANQVAIVTDGHGRYLVPVFSVAPNGEATYVGTVVYREITDDAPPCQP